GSCASASTFRVRSARSLTDAMANLENTAPFEPGAALVSGATADEVELAVAAEEWLAYGLMSTPAERVEAEVAVRLAYDLAGLAAPERILWRDSPLAGARTAAAAQADGTAGASVRTQVRTVPWAGARAELMRDLGPVGWSRHWAA